MQTGVSVGTAKKTTLDNYCIEIDYATGAGGIARDLRLKNTTECDSLD